MEGNAGRGGAVRVHLRRPRCLYYSSEQGVCWGDEAEVLLAPVEERQGKTQQRLGQIVSCVYHIACVLMRLGSNGDVSFQ